MDKLIQIVTESLSALSVPLVPLQSTNTDDTVSYSFCSVSNDGIKEQLRLELRINTKMISRAEEIKSSILSAIVTKGDEPRNDLLQCVVNGGGQLKDDETGLTQTIIYFSILRKVR